VKKYACKREHWHDDDSICNRLFELIRPKNTTLSIRKSINNLSNWRNHFKTQGPHNKLLDRCVLK